MEHKEGGREERRGRDRDRVREKGRVREPRKERGKSYSKRAFKNRMKGRGGGIGRGY